MNLTQFLKKADAAIEGLPHENLVMFVHNLARSLPEQRRERFLADLYGISETAEADDGRRPVEARDPADLKKELARIQPELLKIENGEICLNGELNEEYDDWYDSMDNEFIFSDPKNVIETLIKACDLLHQCVECELYEEGYALSDRLLTLEVIVGGDYADYDSGTFTLKKIEESGLGEVHYRRLVLDSLYTAYRAKPLEERVDALYRIICSAECSSITLENLMQEGREELEQLPEFLVLWINYLGLCSGKTAETLLTEAVNLQNDSGQMLDAARRFHKQHPGLYENYLKKNLTGKKSGELLEIGREALLAVLPQYVTRSRIALLTSIYAQQLNNQDEAERCWLEAFRSDTKPVQYLRLMVESRDFSNYREEARRIYQEVYKKDRSGSAYQYSELRENYIDSKTYYALAFFDGEFRHVIEKGMSEKKALGWTSTFMKEGIGLFLLYLHDGDLDGAGCRAMRENIVHELSFTTVAYTQGLLHPSGPDNISMFWKCFCDWKKTDTTPVAEKQYILKKLEKWIEIRVKGIMDGNHRKHYDECAAFVAALGEVKEAMGEENGKAKLMEAYRSDYSRRSAFYRELCAYGMREHS